MSETSIPETPSYVLPEMLPTEELTKFCEGKTFLIYGAAPGSSRNIGSELARTALVNGAANVVLFDIRRENLEEYAEKLNAQLGNRAHAFYGDITEVKYVKAATKYAASIGGGYLDAMVDSVGVFMIGLPEDINVDHTQKAMTGYVGAALSTQAAWDQMKDQGKRPGKKVHIGVAGSIAKYYDQDVELYTANMLGEAAIIRGLNNKSRNIKRRDIKATETILGFVRTSSFDDTVPISPDVSIKALTDLFEPIAVDPAKAAEAILKGMAKGKETNHYPAYGAAVKYTGPLINAVSRYLTDGTFVPLLRINQRKNRGH